MRKQTKQRTYGIVFLLLTIVLLCIAVWFIFAAAATPVTAAELTCPTGQRYYLGTSSYTVGEYLGEATVGTLLPAPMDYYTIEVLEANGTSTTLAVGVNKATSRSLAAGEAVTIYGAFKDYPSSTLSDARDWYIPCLRQEAGYLPFIIATWCFLAAGCASLSLANFLEAKESE